MAVKIKLHPPVFLTTLALTTRWENDGHESQSAYGWDCTNLYEADNNGISARVNPITQHRVIILSKKYHLLLPAAIPAHSGRSGELTP